MNRTGPNVNPYEAPGVAPDNPVLAADTEFLFNDGCVAGIGTVLLPRICVVTGSTESLVVRESRLWWCSRWIRIISLILCLLGCLVGMPLLIDLPRGTRLSAANTPITVWLQVILGASLTAAAILSIAAYFTFRSSVRVRWSISQKVISQSFHRRLRNLFLAIAITSGIGYFGGAKSMGGALMSGLWAVSSLVHLIRGKRVLVVVGTYEGLFLIGGMSEKFLAETRKLVEAYNAKH